MAERSMGKRYGFWRMLSTKAGLATLTAVILGNSPVRSMDAVTTASTGKEVVGPGGNSGLNTVGNCFVATGDSVANSIGFRPFLLPVNGAGWLSLLALSDWA